MRGQILSRPIFGLSLAISCAIWTGDVRSSFGQETRPAHLPELVQQLGDADARIRDAAEQKLWEAGIPAEGLLTEAAAGPDPEIASRARRILNDVSFGIPAATPPKIIELLREYRIANPDRKAEIVTDLRNMPPIARHALARIWLAESGSGSRDLIFRWHPVEETLIWARDMIADGDERRVPELLRSAGLSGNANLARNAAAYYLLNNTLDAEIANSEKDLAVRADKNEGLFLVFAYRAKGDLDGAWRAAGLYADEATKAAIAQERGDWASAAASLQKAANPWVKPNPAAPILAAYYRLAGDEARCKQVIADASAGQAKSVSPINLFMLNDQPAEGIDRLSQELNDARADDALAAEVITLLCEQMRFREAAVLVETKYKRSYETRMALARGLYRFGAKKESTTIFEELQAEAALHKDIPRYISLAGTFRELGMSDRADELLVAMFRGTGYQAPTSQFLFQMLPGIGVAPERWWMLDRRLHPEDDSAATFLRLRRFFSGTLPANDSKLLLTAAQSNSVLNGGVEDGRWIGETIRRSVSNGVDVTGLEKLALSAKGSDPVSAFGDALAQKGQWDRAAEFYGQAWQRDRDSGESYPLHLLLQGTALVKAGHPAEGRMFIEHADRLSAVSEFSRMDLVQALREHGAEADAQRREDLAPRIGDFNDYVTIQVSERKANVLTATDPLAAASFWETEILSVMQGKLFFISATGYLNVPHKYHALRAKGYKRAGNFDGALREWQLCLAYYPLDSDSAAESVNILASTGRAAEADALYAKVRDGLRSLLADYPDNANPHNSLAWLAARSRRDLDMALEQAGKAVELEPKSPACIDTLAEVHLARGDKAGALELMHKALELMPANPQLLQRLKDIEESK